MALVSTVAIGLTGPGSDPDIPLPASGPGLLAATLAAQGWQVRSKGEQVWIAEQNATGQMASAGQSSSISPQIPSSVSTAGATSA